jgi:tetratricopeptide (TPR) repeat protein
MHALPLLRKEEHMKRFSLVVGVLLPVICAFILLDGPVFAGDEGKMPITTGSAEAREYYLKGRDLFERLRGQESIEYFEKAIAEDQDFALAYLNLAFVTPSAKGFFENLDKAKALADKVSEGERLWILGAEAAANGLQMDQRELYQRMVAAYPDDERAHNLLGNHYFGLQEYARAIAEYEKATAIAPDFSQPYNQLGYSYRFLERYDEAAKAFEKYIELIPDDPNPYDSYAELLMKIGKYDESIAHYRKALEQDSNFVASHIGIATNLNFKGRHKDARKQLKKLYDMARNNGERRAAHFTLAVSYVDEGDMAKALAELDKQYAFAEQIDDAAAMSGDLILMGNILYESGKLDKAMAKYEKAVEVVRESDLSQEVKDNTELNFLYNAGAVSIKRGDLETARAKAAQYLKGVEALRNPNQVRLAHQLAGMIALEAKDYDAALEEFRQASQLNPYNLYRMALAYKGKGDAENAEDLCRKAAGFNALNNMNYAFMRRKAQDMLDSM